MVVQTVRLNQINNVEPVDSTLSRITYSEVEPLSEGYCAAMVIF
jgi:hypothetical protein